MRILNSLFLLCALLSPGSWSLCPEECLCDQTDLNADCTYSQQNDLAPLEVIPIMLNPSLQNLNLRGNKMKKLEGALQVYIHLRSLDISMNELRSLGRRQFEQLTKLQSLNLSNNFLTNLHARSFSGLETLQVLDLNDNGITNIDGKPFQMLSSLIELKLGNNKLAVLSDEFVFTGLGRLRVLYLNGNKLSSLRESWFKPLENLRFLYLSSNKLTALPENFKPSHGLRLVDLSKNKLEIIADGAFGRSLDFLDVSYNVFTSVPNNLQNYPKLKTLIISGNPIKRLDESSFRSLRALEALSVSNMDDLTFVGDNCFDDNVELKELYMEDNPNLSPIPQDIFKFNNRLTKLSFRNNDWRTLTPRQLPTSIQTFGIKGLPLVCNCSVVWLWELYQQNRLSIDPVLCEDGIELSSVPVDNLACPDYGQILLLVSLCIVGASGIVAISICIIFIFRRRSKARKYSEGIRMYTRNDDTMIYSPPRSIAPPEPFYYEINQVKLSSEEDSSKYSSSGYVGSELWAEGANESAFSGGTYSPRASTSGYLETVVTASPLSRFSSSARNNSPFRAKNNENWSSSLSPSRLNNLYI